MNEDRLDLVDLVELVFGKEGARQLREYEDYLIIEELVERGLEL